MKALVQSARRLGDPVDYFTGVGLEALPTPRQMLLFLRTSVRTLQQKTLQNRSHHRFVLLFNLETKGTVHVDNLMIPLRPGEALLVFPFQFHHYSGLASQSLQWLFCTFELAPKSFLEPLRNRPLVMRDDVRSGVEKLLATWHGRRTELDAQRLQASLIDILLLLKLSRQRTGRDAPPEPTDQLLLRVNQLLGESRGRTVVTEDLAEALGYSGSRLRALFRKTAGIPIGRYIQNFRLNRAMFLLRTTSRSIGDIAEEAGFGSPQAFSRLFRMKTRMTPREYRRRG